MKIILLVIAGAFAAQDTTPPVISLSFYGHTGNTNYDVPLGYCKDLDANDATDCATKTATECGAATTECEWRITGKCRTHKTWNAADSSGASSDNFDNAFAACKAKNDKSSCESDTTNVCHWVSLGDDVPKWYFDTSHNSGAGHHEGHAQTSKRASVTCVVGSTSVTCPDPKCTKTDHHDGTGECDNPHVVLVRGGNDRHTVSPLFNANPLSYTATEARDKYDDGVGEGVSIVTGPIANPTCTVSKSSTSPSTCVNRADVGQYLVTYTASDASGNKAEPVAFSFLFIDPFTPKLDFSSHNADVQDSYSSRMFGYPNPSTVTLSDFSGSVEGKAIFPGTDSFGCGASCEEDRLDDTTGKTWGALYSAVGSESANKALVDTLWNTAFTVAPDASVDGDSDLRTLTGAGGSYTPTTISAGAITALNLASPYGTHTVKTKTSQDFEAGVIKSRRYGGFFDEVEKKEQDPDKGAGFCANDIANPSAVSCAGLDETTCGTTTGCNWHGEATRASSALWSYPVNADAEDNYRCENMGGNSCNALKVYYQLTEDSTQFEWALAQPGHVYATSGKTSTGTHNIVMKPGKKVRISWFVDDSAGDFGFKQMSNPQTHTIQFSVTDKTRPILTPAQKAAYDANDFQTDAAGFALDPTVLNDDKLTTFGYASVTCAEINDENLCTGTCSWNAASGCTGSGVMQSCVSKVVSTDSDDSAVCYGKATAAACWAVKNQCFWTTSKTFKDGAFTDGDANSAITCVLPLVEYTYYVPDCTATTNDAAGKQNAKCDAGSVQWTSSNQVKYRSYKKCRPADNVVDTTSFQTLSKNAYTTVVECGYKEDNNPYPVSSTPTAQSGYQEFGARAFDNWDNVREYSDANGNAATEYKKIDLFTDGAATAGNPCATTDGTTSPNWVSCAKQSGTPAAPQTSFVGNTLSHKTAVMGQGGYGAIYNGQLEKTTTGTVSRWPQRGLYYRSGLLNCDFASDRTNSCDEKDFENDFLVVYRYTDKEGNSARPLMRKVVTRDTTAPSVRLVGDRTLENSAGSYVHSTASSNLAQCVQAQNRSAACAPSDPAQTVDDKSSCETAGCIWSYEDADNYGASGNGLFDTNRIITAFEHRDDCDKDIITTVSMYSGLCASGTRTKLTCTAGTECYAGIFQYRSSNAASDPDAYEQPSSAHNLMSSNDARMQTFPEWTAGDYSITYEAMDSAGHKHSECRDIYNVDHTFPIIQILGSDQMTLEATHQGNYIDDGATCSDQVDGVISQNVEVSGDVVNLSKVGTYTITYNCKDSANNAAPAARRTVVVAQTSCPRCHVFGKDEINHEASFPYADAGAACSDVIDGTTTTKCYTSNGDPDVEATDCKGSTLVDVDTTGTYTIQYKSTNTVGLWNNGANCRGGPISYYRTVQVMDTLRPVISLKYATAAGSSTLVARGTAGNNDGATDGSGSGANTNLGLDNAAEGAYKGKTNDLGDSSSGAYPEGDIAAQGYPNWKHGANGQFVDPEAHLSGVLMAEESTSSVNGWVVGAIASAVAGLALLGYSTRRTAVATSVPV